MWNQWPSLPVVASTPPNPSSSGMCQVPQIAPPQPVAPPLPSGPPPPPPHSTTLETSDFIGPVLPKSSTQSTIRSDASTTQYNPYAQYTAAQYSTMTPEQQYAIQQHWQQWQAYQQEYAKWHAQYGEQYKREMAMAASTCGISGATSYQGYYPQAAVQLNPAIATVSPVSNIQPKKMEGKILGQPQLYNKPPPPLKKDSFPQSSDSHYNKFTKPPPNFNIPKSFCVESYENISEQTTKDSIEQPLKLGEVGTYANETMDPILAQDHHVHNDSTILAFKNNCPNLLKSTNDWKKPALNTNSTTLDEYPRTERSVIESNNHNKNNGDGYSQIISGSFADVSNYLRNRRSDDHNITNSANRNLQNERNSINVGVDELAFDKQFRQWEEQFEIWKRANINRLEPEVYQHHEREFEKQRIRLIERREQIRKRKMIQTKQASSDIGEFKIDIGKSIENSNVLQARNSFKRQDDVFSRERFFKSSGLNASKIKSGCESSKGENINEIISLCEDPDDNVQNISNEINVNARTFLSPSDVIPGLDLVSEETYSKDNLQNTFVKLNSESSIRKDSLSKDQSIDKDGPTIPPKVPHLTTGPNNVVKKIPSLFDVVVENPNISFSRNCDIFADSSSKIEGSNILNVIPDIAHSLKDPTFLQNVTNALAHIQTKTSNDLPNMQEIENSSNINLVQTAHDMDSVKKGRNFNEWSNYNISRRNSSNVRKNSGHATDQSFFNHNSNKRNYGPNSSDNDKRCPDTILDTSKSNRNFEFKDRSLKQKDYGSNNKNNIKNARYEEKTIQPDMNILNKDREIFEQNRPRTSFNDRKTTDPNYREDEKKQIRNPFALESPRETNITNNDINESLQKNLNNPFRRNTSFRGISNEGSDTRQRSGTFLNKSNSSYCDDLLSYDGLISSNVIDYDHKSSGSYKAGAATDLKMHGFKPLKTIDYGHCFPKNHENLHQITQKRFHNYNIQSQQNVDIDSKTKKIYISDREVQKESVCLLEENPNIGQKKNSSSISKMDFEEISGSEEDVHQKQRDYSASGLKNSIINATEKAILHRGNRRAINNYIHETNICHNPKIKNAENFSNKDYEEISETEEEILKGSNDETTSTILAPPPPCISLNNEINFMKSDNKNAYAENFSKLTDTNQEDFSHSSPNEAALLPINNNKNTISIDTIVSEKGRLSRPKKICIILRGPPGSGKSHVAKLLKDKEIEMGNSHVRILSIDDYFIIENEYDEICHITGKKVAKKELLYEYDKDMEDIYLQHLFKAFKKTIADNLYDFLVIDCNNSNMRSLNEFYCHSKDSGYVPYVIDLFCDADKCIDQNIHDRTEQDIKEVIKNWNPTPIHYIKLDISNLVDNALKNSDKKEKIHRGHTEAEFGDINNECSDYQSCGFSTSKWDNDKTFESLARLDGTNKLRSKKKEKSMEDYLQLDEWEPLNTTGKKKVRWADIEERRKQEKMRAIGFVVGQTDWERMMDPNAGNRALNKTKYIERVKKIR